MFWGCILIHFSFLLLTEYVNMYNSENCGNKTKWPDERKTTWVFVFFFFSRKDKGARKTIVRGCTWDWWKRKCFPTKCASGYFTCHKQLPVPVYLSLFLICFIPSNVSMLFIVDLSCILTWYRSKIELTRVSIKPSGSQELNQETKCWRGRRKVAPPPSRERIDLFSAYTGKASAKPLFRNKKFTGYRVETYVYTVCVRRSYRNKKKENSFFLFL